MCRRGRQEKIPTMGNKTKKKEKNKEKKKKNIYLSAGIHCTRGRHYTTAPRNPTLINNLQIFYLKHLPRKIWAKNTL